MPLLNIPASDIRIRPELTALLPHANIESNHLITLDDLPPLASIAEQLKPELTRWILVDHNSLQGRLGEIYSQRVFGCIDHHVDERKVPERDEHDPRIITKTGSCTSLVVNHFRAAWDRLSGSASASNTAGGQGDADVGYDDNAVRRTWDAQVAKLALASVLIDTHNLTSVDKVEEHDRKAVRYLESEIFLAPRGGAQFDRKAFFDQLSEAKKSLDDLSLAEILRKDYKQWTEKGKNLGIASIVKPLSYLEKKCSAGRFLNELDAFAKEHDLAILSLMTTSTSDAGDFQRELLLRVVDPSCEAIAVKFQEAASQQLGLDDSHDFEVAEASSSSSSSSLPTRVWWQRELGKSRKQVAPLLREAMNS